MAEVKFEIINHIGVLSTSKSGWTKELNVVSWNGGPPKYDIREWNEDHTKMSKGITMNEEEIGQLRLLIIN